MNPTFRTRGLIFLALGALAPAAAPQAPVQGARTADAFPSSNVQLMSWIYPYQFPGNGSGNDCWGYTAPSGREYGMYGADSATGIVEITDPANPVVVATMAGPSSTHRDIKTYLDKAYAVSEGGEGIQVFDLSNIDAGVVTFLGSTTAGSTNTTTHNVAIDEDSGFLYRCGTGSGLLAYDLTNPGNLPVFTASIPGASVHDTQVVTYDSGPFAGRQVAFNCTGFSDDVEIYDVTNKANPILLSSFTYPNAAHAHQAWLSEDRQYLYLDDESDEIFFGVTTTMWIFDVSDLLNPVTVGSFTNGNTSADHNLFVKGDRVYAANYLSGLRVYDLTDPESPSEIGFFDTHGSTDAAAQDGLWGNYPFFPSGLVVGSDQQKGLFVLWPEAPLVAFGLPSGTPELIDPAGHVLTVNVSGDSPGDLDPSTVTLHYDLGAGPVDVAMTDLGSGDYQAALPAVPCGTEVAYWFSARSTNGWQWRAPEGFAHAAFLGTAATFRTVAASFDVETPLGWTAGAVDDDATTGIWEHGDPFGTYSQPESDHSPSGTGCWFTGQGTTAGFNGVNDVDGGKTTLTSPDFDVSGLVEPRIGYWRWFANAGGTETFADVFVVEASGDGGTSWFPVETVGPTGPQVEGGWFHHSFRVADVVPGASQVRLRFVAADLNLGSFVEAAVDDVSVFELDCDCDGSGTSDLADIAAGLVLDLDGDAQPDTCQPLSADLGGVSVSLGGVQTLSLDAGSASAGMLHLLLGTVTGTSPGLPSGTFVLPLNFDPYTNYTLNNPNIPPLTNSLGALDGSGQATASFSLPAATTANLVGVTAHHAYAVLSPFTGETTLVSNAIPVELLP